MLTKGWRSSGAKSVLAVFLSGNWSASSLSGGGLLSLDLPKAQLVCELSLLGADERDLCLYYGWQILETVKFE